MWKRWQNLCDEDEDDAAMLAEFSKELSSLD